MLLLPIVLVQLLLLAHPPPSAPARSRSAAFALHIIAEPNFPAGSQALVATSAGQRAPSAIALRFAEKLAACTDPFERPGSTNASAIEALRKLLVQFAAVCRGSAAGGAMEEAFGD